MSTPPLEPANVHLWHIPLPHGTIDADTGVLGATELARAARFASPKLRNIYLHTHAAKRHILASYADISAKDLAFGVNSCGKPYLRGTHATPDIRFNLTHTRTTGILAVARGREVGVDIEALERNVSVLPLAQRYFSDQVLGHLEQLAGAQQRGAFLRYWTQFEAYKKAQGEGLRGGDAGLTFKLDPTPGNCFQPLPFPTRPVDWQVAELNHLAGYAISVVIEADSGPPAPCWMEYRAQ